MCARDQPSGLPGRHELWAWRLESVALGWEAVEVAVEELAEMEAEAVMVAEVATFGGGHDRGWLMPSAKAIEGDAADEEANEGVEGAKEGHAQREEDSAARGERTGERAGGHRGD